MSDVTKLRQILINLIGNALKFTTKGAITVRVHKLEGESTAESAALKLQFAVKDSGSGIAADELSSLFEPFVQTSSGRKIQEGTGLGLTISRRFAGMMGGDIQVESKVGVGTTFTFTIACHAAPEVETQTLHMHEQIIGLAPGQPAYRIMVVDDKWANRQLLLKLLKPLGFEVREAENGQEAVEIAPVFKPHLIWMDIRMPVMDGMEATKQLKAMPIGNSLKIIALTASVHEEEQAEILTIGCDDFVRKPIHANTVFEILSKYIGVQYVYADSPPQQSLVPQEALPLDEVKFALSSIPADLLVRLSESTELGDLTIIKQTIAEIQGHHAELGETLHRLAQRFQFDELLALLKEEQLS